MYRVRADLDREEWVLFELLILIPLSVIAHLIPVNSTQVLIEYDDDYDYDVEIYDGFVNLDISIDTVPETFTVKLGESVILPCRTSQFSDVIMEEWTHGNVRLFGNIDEKNNFDLKVNVTSESDAGMYTCFLRFFQYVNKSVSHTIVIVPETTESEVAVDLHEISSTASTHILSTTQKLQVNENEVQESYPRFGLLTTLSEAVDTNVLFGMPKDRLAQVKSSASSLNRDLWTLGLGIVILRIATR